MGTNKGEKLNEPESDPSPICKKKKNGPSLARMDSACRAPSAPDGLADLYCGPVETSYNAMETRHNTTETCCNTTKLAQHNGNKLQHDGNKSQNNGNKS